MAKDKRDHLVDWIRSAMYGTSDVLHETEVVAQLLAEIDGVPCAPEHNRLIIALKMLKDFNKVYDVIDKVNE